MATTEIISMCVLMLTIVASCIAMILTMEYVRKNRYTRYNDKETSVRLDKAREYYEEMLYKLQNELMENERRWKDVNHIIVSGQSDGQIVLDTEKKPSVISFLENLGIDLGKIEVEKKSVFVLTPFLNEEADTFTAIKKVCGDVNLSCTRGDEVYRDKNILSHIVTSILQSKIIIANINGRNPNVFYELGICHAIGKPVILISQTKSDLPFDINGKNIVFYNDLAELQVLLKNELLKIFISGEN